LGGVLGDQPFFNISETLALSARNQFTQVSILNRDLG
jgi:hypothetical protein